MIFPLLHLDGRILAQDEARVPPLSTGFLCGSGTFTTAPVTARGVFQWSRHRARLRAGCDALGLDWSGAAGESLETAVVELARAVDATASGGALARIMLFEGQGALWRAAAPAGPRTHRMILLRPAPEEPPPARVGISGWPVFSGAPLRGLKLLSYAEPWLALEQARAAGFDEALRLNERREVAGGCRAGVLWVRGGEVYGSAPECGGLESTTQAWAVERLRARGVPVALGACQEGELARAEELLLFSAGVGVWSAAEFQGRTLPGAGGAVAAMLRAAYTDSLGG